MPSKWTIFEGTVVALSVATALKTRIEAKKAAALYLDSHESFVEIQRANEAQIQYLCHMLDKHDIPADEFDLIALHYNM